MKITIHLCKNFFTLLCEGTFINFFICSSSAWFKWMVCMTALDIQISLSNQMANIRGLFLYYMAACGIPLSPTSVFLFWLVIKLTKLSIGQRVNNRYTGIMCDTEHTLYIVKCQAEGCERMRPTGKLTMRTLCLFPAILPRFKDLISASWYEISANKNIQMLNWQYM